MAPVSATVDAALHQLLKQFGFQVLLLVVASLLSVSHTVVLRQCMDNQNRQASICELQHHKAGKQPPTMASCPLKEQVITHREDHSALPGFNCT